MNLLDLVLIGLAVSAAVGGFGLGFVARVASWIGSGIGLVGAALLLPRLLRSFTEAEPLVLMFLAVGVLLLGAVVGGAVGETAGRALRSAVPPGLRTLDRIGGALAGAFGIAVSVWLIAPLLADVPGDFARVARRSEVVATITDIAPPPPDHLRVLRSIIGETRFPQVFEDLQPAPVVGPPPEATGIDGAVLAGVVRSTVNVEADGCGGRHEGSGWTVAPDTIITNAHVVAGAQRIRLRRPDGRLIAARAVVFDDDRDLAVLEAPGLGQDPLPVASAGEGTRGAVVGYPGGQNQPRIAPAAIARRIDAVGRDIYDRDRTRRSVYIVASDLAQGDSGGAMVNARGQVIGVAFAIAPDEPATAYVLADNEIRAVLAAPRRPGVGPCMG